MKNNVLPHKTLMLLSVFFCAVFLLLIYCFYPVLNYDSSYSQHVSHKLWESQAPWNILMYDRNWTLITDKKSENWYYKHITTDINSQFVQDLILIEDKNYYSHYWVNVLSKFRALKDNLSWEKISGASTITEQYIKNKYFKNSQRSILQKLREAILAVYFNIIREKDQILNIYYHDAYFWNQLYWVWAALEVYFDKDNLDDLTQEETVLLLSLLNNPWISSLEETYFQEYFNRVKERLWYSFKRTYFGKLNTKKNINTFPFVTNLYISSPQHSLEGEWVVSRPNWIHTTIDSELQKYTKEVISEQLIKLQWKNVTNAAVFAIIPWNDVLKIPQEVLIYQWSRDFYSQHIDWQVDVIQAKRQPGSTVKPFLYLMWLESGMNPDDLLIDIESEYNSFQDWKSYVTENYSLKEYGLVRMKKALWNSMNNATVRLASELWLENVYNFYKDYWFSFDFDAQHYWYSLVLWNAETTLENLVENYAKLIPPSYPVTLQEEGAAKSDVSILSPEGGELERGINKFLLQDMLSDPDNRDISFWVNSILSTSIPQAVKTGTSSDFRDNWVVSYHKDLVVGVWVWNNDNSSMIWVTWMSGAWNIWHKVVEKAIELGYIKDEWVIIPEWIEQWKYCLDYKCFQKELIYKKKGKQYFSRILNWDFSRKDLSEKLSNFEEEKLLKMWIQLTD